jgi:ABC-2 type transport system ATP-binding protein
MAAALSLQDIRIRYGDRVVVDRVSLQIQRGEVIGLLGPNGSGKSTTLAAAAGAIDPFEGTILVEGIARKQDPAAFAMKVGLVPQEPALFDELTAAENLLLFGKLFGLRGKDLRQRVIRALSRLGVGDRAGHRVSTLSGGLKQRVNLAAALIHNPTVLLLDEPTASLDTASRDRLLADLLRLRDEGHAILFSTHHWEEAAIACDRVAVLERGKLTAYGAPRDLIRRPADRAVLYGHLRTRPTRIQVQSLRDRLGLRIELEVTGRRVRLAAATSEELGRALARLLAEGWNVESFRTPPGVLERTIRNCESQAPSGAEAS